MLIYWNPAAEEEKENPSCVLSSLPPSSLLPSPLGFSPTGLLSVSPTFLPPAFHRCSPLYLEQSFPQSSSLVPQPPAPALALSITDSSSGFKHCSCGRPAVTTHSSTPLTRPGYFTTPLSLLDATGEEGSWLFCAVLSNYQLAQCLADIRCSINTGWIRERLPEMNRTLGLNAALSGFHSTSPLLGHVITHVKSFSSYQAGSYLQVSLTLVLPTAPCP